ncbi:ABC transporter substrate-binding protein [Paenibacillus abyssi]|uniref:ABC transporter substrate-binding protein n=1 Tax=Paenibacillus abyssi TaxID=1340531 RepID=A0A917G569_9BACL|nr:ABC transporter substrate-binding protein [Paenibacillus abyssi]GGG22413.1 ABC transporter substrate-binding protein [Paenibacillus abyssi]
MSRKRIMVLLSSAIVLVALLVTVVYYAHSSLEQEGQATLPSGENNKITLEILNPKVEIASQFEQMVNDYMKEHPHVQINVRTVGGGADDRAELRAMFAYGQGPDIFTNGGYEEARLYRDYLEDLSDQPWVQNAIDMALEPMTLDGKVYGMPVNIEGYGFIYNKDLFKQAGIVELPTTLSELTESASRLKSAGITPFANAYAEKWVLGVHLINIAFAHQDNTDEFIRNLSRGTESIEGNPHFLDLLKLLDVTLEYGNDQPLTFDYNAQVSEFAQGKAAMIQQGNWIQPMLDQITSNMNIGMLPIPINDNPGNDALAVGVPNNWVINKKSSEQKKAEAKLFLNWMVSSEQGKMHLVERLKFIPAFHHIQTDSLGPLADDILRYSYENKTLSWNWYTYPDGVSDYEFGPVMQAYIGDQMTAEQVLQQLQTLWETTNEHQTVDE